MSFKTNLLAFAAMGTIAIAAAPTASAQSKTIVEIKSGDTLTSIADAHNTTYVRIFDANETLANPDIINAGDTVRIPTADEELPNRYGDFTAASAAAAVSYVAPVASASAPTTGTAAGANYTAAAPAPTVVRASSAGNTYYWGQCTWYVKERRPDLPNMLGNGGQWAGNAAAQGYSIGYTAVAGAVAEQPGHVAYVDSVNANGTMNISEMNYAGGVGVVHYRTVPTSGWTYIY